MAAPHISGSAVLLRQLHPTWGPAKIKALLMNQATRKMKNNDLSHPVPATVMGAGRVQLFQSANAHSLAIPGSLSFGLRIASGTQEVVRPFNVTNFDTVGHDYSASGTVRYSDFGSPDLASVDLSLNGTSFGPTVAFHLAPHKSRKVWAQLTLDPAAIEQAEQEFGLFYFNPTVDGSVVIRQDAPHADVMRVAWEAAPLAASQTGVSPSSLDLTGGPQSLSVTSTPSAGTDWADLYQLGGTDPVGSTGEEDIVAVGARSFTGDSIDGDPAGVPTGTDPLVGVTWQEFLTNDDTPTEPVEFGVQTAGVHNTTETLEVDVKVDAGADGVFADPAMQADYLVVKQTGQGGVVCVYDLSQPDPFDQCAADYFADYSNYNSNLVGLVVDASAIGLNDSAPELAYQVTACTGRFSGDVPGTFCDSAGSFDDSTGTWDMTLDTTDPALAIGTQVCGGFWGTDSCAGGSQVAVGSAQPGDDPSILALFPNNAPSRTPTVVTTTT
jgi:hypothetical protein